MLLVCLAVVFVCQHINLHFYYSSYFVAFLLCEINDFISCKMFASEVQFLQRVGIARNAERCTS